jgi:hypothetical protein
MTQDTDKPLKLQGLWARRLTPGHSCATLPFTCFNANERFVSPPRVGPQRQLLVVVSDCRRGSGQRLSAWRFGKK